jgi:hypothetical protein
MIKRNYEKGLIRIACTLGILYGIELVLILIYSSKSWLSFGLHLAMAFIVLVPIGKICFFVVITIASIFLIRFFIRGFRFIDLAGQQEIDTKKIYNHIIISVLVIIFTVCSSIGYFIYSWYWQTHTGERSGRVVDAVTGKPIEGATVNYTWKLSKFMTMGGGIAASYETTTDKNGFYLIPNQRVASQFVTSKHVIKRNVFIESLKREEVNIYKDGYSVYQITQYKRPLSESPSNSTHEYRKKNNLVKLFPLGVEK